MWGRCRSCMHQIHRRNLKNAVLAACGFLDLHHEQGIFEFLAGLRSRIGHRLTVSTNEIVY